MLTPQSLFGASESLIVLAASLLCWPNLRAANRLPGREEPGRREHRSTRWPRGRDKAEIASVPVAAVAGVLVAGVGGLCAGTALAVLARRYRRSRSDFRRRLSRCTELATGVRLLVAELRAGAHPAVAAEGAAADSAFRVAGIFGDMAAAARLGGDVASTLSGSHEVTAELREPVGRLARCWMLAERHGVALADLLDAVRRDLEHRAAFMRDVEAKMAGPRATALVLAGLPVLGIVLGEMAGAGPVAVLTGGPVGQGLLMAGTALLCTGVLWTVRLTESVVQS
ncbi:type II secretion system F family protein [Haloactinomyces albus]|uniref:Tight adherence protein B n=1 Tax=Haloactinomyces albus TaxID=1352928 RepID=A0AAE3ZB81_9ACTN|nr:type II secretion system F family protein [Haloactinomyces albus]MDR7301716.1 tight adherence protein B [Haloactinomyces albus]